MPGSPRTTSDPLSPRRAPASTSSISEHSYARPSSGGTSRSGDSAFGGTVCCGGTSSGSVPSGGMQLPGDPVPFGWSVVPIRLRLRAQAQPRQVGARRDGELGEDLAQVVVDRARAEVELPADLAVGQTVGDEARYLELLRRELAEARGVALARGLAARSQLPARAILPG